MGVQNLLKKHNLLQSELVSHEARVTAVSKEAEAMVSEGHYGADDITTRLGQLSSKWTQLKVRTDATYVGIVSGSCSSTVTQLLNLCGDSGWFFSFIAV